MCVFQVALVNLFDDLSQTSKSKRLNRREKKINVSEIQILGLISLTQRLLFNKPLKYLIGAAEVSAQLQQQSALSMHT
jgi:hypothetical protein